MLSAQGSISRAWSRVLLFLAIALLGAMNLGVNCNPVGGGMGECGCTAPQDSICG